MDFSHCGSYFLGSLVASLADTQLRTFLLATMVFTSPPILLLVERSSIDILIIVLLALSALSISRGWIICAIGLVVAASIFKFFGSVAAVAMYFQWKMVA